MTSIVPGLRFYKKIGTDERTRITPDEATEVFLDIVRDAINDEDDAGTAISTHGRDLITFSYTGSEGTIVLEVEAFMEVE